MTNNAWNTPDSSANGQLLIGQAGGKPVWATLTEGTAVTITEGAGSITVAFDAISQDFELITSATANGSSSINFTGLSSSYSTYVVEMENVQPATNNVNMGLQTSTNNGSSYDSGASDYAWAMLGASSGGYDAEGDDADGAIRLVGPPDEELGTVSNETLSGRLWIFNPSSSNWTKISFIGSYTDDSPDYASINTGGERFSTTAVNAIRLVMSSGNIATGNFRLYGFKA